MQVVGNRVTSRADTDCGGIHPGIDIGTHMSGGGCVGDANPTQVGVPGPCVHEPLPPQGGLCIGGTRCQVWAHFAQGASFTLRGNHVDGAQINILIEGLDLVGDLVESGNTSGTTRMSDRESARNGCPVTYHIDTWGTIDRAAHHPSPAGWTDQRVHCER
jgi:hypothetical protein